ncbi:polyprenyl synthetase family protein [Streptomyces sp. A1547]|uniref:polyprenyl synthetase family protein n=1 Tax=Streptomyces sp. A1547 TaxID=2563105 RepID=UPI00109E8684|nr:polyprenyl synthetase family protein [Streptomyces sp. A1547]THA39932.1 polyprenyl synthetase family protein [Streptomyces sp. A1547]
MGGQLSLRGGKRLRPALVYEAARLVTDEEVPGLDEVALSLELLQMHGLVHDDIIDDSPERPGGPSTYYAYRQEFPHDERTALALAILAGDLAAFLSVRVLLDGAASDEVKQAMLRVQLDTGAQTVAGQITDLERDSSPLPDEELLHCVTEFKSTRYSILAPLRLGLPAAGADLAADDERVLRYATALGIAGQMRNDYLDLSGEGGAGPGSDIRAGRRTYAVQAVLAATGGAERAVVEKALGDVDCPRESVDHIRDLARRHGIDARIRADIRRHAQTATAEAAAGTPHWRTEAVSFFTHLPHVVAHTVQ